jgi:hypothetical protein
MWLKGIFLWGDKDLTSVQPGGFVGYIHVGSSIVRGMIMCIQMNATLYTEYRYLKRKDKKIEERTS